MTLITLKMNTWTCMESRIAFKIISARVQKAPNVSKPVDWLRIPFDLSFCKWIVTHRLTRSMRVSSRFALAERLKQRIDSTINKNKCLKHTQCNEIQLNIKWINNRRVGKVQKKTVNEYEILALWMKHEKCCNFQWLLSGIECKRPSCQATTCLSFHRSFHPLIAEIRPFELGQMLSHRICTDSCKVNAVQCDASVMTLYCTSNQLHCPFMCRDGSLFSISPVPIRHVVLV